MIIHIIGDDVKKPLEPHRVENTMCVNEARGIINQLKQPMADITQLIQDKLRALQKQTQLLAIDDLDINDLKKNLVIPIIDIEVEELAQPVTVCTSAKCAKIYKVQISTNFIYMPIKNFVRVELSKIFEYCTALLFRQVNNFQNYFFNNDLSDQMNREIWTFHR